MTRPSTTAASEFPVPSALYGPAAEVRRAAGRFVTAVRKGRSIREAVGDEMVVVDLDHPGLVVIERSWSTIGANEPQFHLDLPWRRLDGDRIKSGDLAGFGRASREALAQPWSFIGLLGGQIYAAVRTAEAQLRVVEAAAAHWPVLAAVGARYSGGSNVGVPLADVHTLVTFCLARQGAPLDDLRDLTPGRLHKHIGQLPGIRIRALLEAGDVARAVTALEGHSETVLLSLAEHFLAFGLDDVACDAVAKIATSDPHGHVARWLAGHGDPSRRVW